jgi:hypothetical protein
MSVRARGLVVVQTLAVAGVTGACTLTARREPVATPARTVLVARVGDAVLASSTAAPLSSPVVGRLEGLSRDPELGGDVQTPVLEIACEVGGVRIWRRVEVALAPDCLVRRGDGPWVAMGDASRDVVERVCASGVGIGDLLQVWLNTDAQGVPEIERIEVPK